MAKAKGQVTLNGRFAPGARVRLVRVAGEHVLRSQGGEDVGLEVVADDGSLTFKGLEVGDRFFAVGVIQGRPVEVRLTAREAKDDVGLLSQNPVRPEPTPAPRHVVDPKSEPFGTRLAQEQVGDSVPQRSATPHGTAHPVDPDERAPYPSQDDKLYASGKVPQRSDTPLGQATPIHDVESRQSEVTDGELEQRSDTPHGVTTPLPAGDAVAAVRGIESAVVKAAAGEPGQAEARGVSGLESALANRKRAKKKPAAKGKSSSASKVAAASKSARSRASK